MKLFNITLLTIILVLTACNKNRPAGQDNAQLGTDTTYTVHYAEGFQVKKYNDYTLVSVRDPWDTTRLLQTYILVDRQKELPDGLPQGTIVRTPLSNVATYSTIHCSSLNELGVTDIIKGVCEPQYIKLDTL